jgi:ion channel POLLUX/CASTOR
MKRATLGDRLRYQFDNVMSRGTGALVGALFGVTLLLIALATSVLVLARLKPGGSAEALGVAEALWQVTMRTIDTGTVAGDSGWSFRVVSFAITLGGIFVVSTLIGVLASGLEARLSDLRRGRSRVVESGHAVILGWSPQVFTIVSELALANRAGRDEGGHSAVGRSACVAILADRDKVEMEEEIRTKVPDTMGTRIVCRSGSPIDLDDLKIVSPDTARAVIILSPGGPNPDLPIAKAMMALVKDRRERTHRHHIVTAIHRVTNLQIARMIGGDEAQIFMVDGLMSRLIAQTCSQSGLPGVYAELFSFEGAAVYFHEEPRLAGLTYGEALFRYRAATLMGLQQGDGSVRLNPRMETVIQAGDRLIGIATGRAAFHLTEAVDPVVDVEGVRQLCSAAPAFQRLLILGWNRRGPLIVEQLAHYVPPESQVHVLAPVDPEQMQADVAAIQAGRIHLTFERGNPTDRPTLEKLAVGGYHYVVILSPADAPDVQIADASTILSLLHLRDIAKATGEAYSIVSEILDTRNRDLAEVTSADDVIVSERLVALALAQIAENEHVLSVFAELLTPGGADIRLKPVADYVRCDGPVNFYTVVESARRRGQTAIGYRLLSEAGAPDRAFGVHVNPDKAIPITFAANDRIIVLAQT